MHQACTWAAQVAPANLIFLLRTARQAVSMKSDAVLTAICASVHRKKYDKQNKLAAGCHIAVVPKCERQAAQNAHGAKIHKRRWCWACVFEVVDSTVNLGQS